MVEDDGYRCRLELGRGRNGAAAEADESIAGPMMRNAEPPIAILDVDGTLVDSNYHHAIAWFRAFRELRMTLPIWRIHRHIGMGGDKLVAAVAGDLVEEHHGDEVREAEKRLYRELLPEVCTVDGAAELIEELGERGHPIVLASSANEDEVEHYVRLLNADGRIEAFTTADDVEETKPAPDLVVAAMEKVVGVEAVMIGDSTWDIEAATRAGLETVAVLTGGFSKAELMDGGAVGVYESVEALVADLDSTPLSL